MNPLSAKIFFFSKSSTGISSVSSSLALNFKKLKPQRLTPPRLQVTLIFTAIFLNVRQLMEVTLIRRG